MTYRELLKLNPNQTDNITFIIIKLDEYIN